MQRRPHNFIQSLLHLARGPGGAMLAVVGEAQSGGDYWAGARHKPVKTLFEAVIRCLLAGPYDRIVAFTGHGSAHLPSWSVNPRFRLGDEEVIWLVRGAKDQSPQNAQPAPQRKPWELDLKELEQDTTAPFDRLLWRSMGSDYWDRLENYIKYRDEEMARPDRSAIVVDYHFLVPNAHEATHHSTQEKRAFWDLDQNSARRINGIREQFQTDVRSTRADVVLFSEDGLVHDLLREPTRETPSILLQVMARRMSAYESEHIKPGLEGRLPQLCFASQMPVVAADRAAGPLRGPRLVAPDSADRKPLYEQLRHAMLNRRASVPSPPPQPDEVALEFWANVDLTPLRNAFDSEIIGQAEAKATILGLLEDQKRKCALVLEHGGQARQVRKTARDQTFVLPAVGLFGAAGMGKTTFCNVIVERLFGDSRFGRVIDLSGKNIKVATIGVEPPMVGCDDESDLMLFGKESGGLGVVCFDEFTRISMIGHLIGSLGTELGPVLQLLQERKFEPANPKHRPPGRFYHFANTLFIFSANVSPQGEARLSGFHSVEDLGPQFTTRVPRIVYFTPLKDEDYRLAAERSLARQAYTWASNFKPAAVPLAQGEVAVEAALIQAVEERLKQIRSQSGETASIRRLHQIVEGLRYDKAFEEAEARGGDRLILGTSLIPSEWPV